MTTFVPFKYNPSEMPSEDIEASFVGRRHLLDRLLEAIGDQTGTGTIQHYLLLGQRGIGKTTLLLIVAERVKKDLKLAGKWLVVRYREEEFFVYTLRDLLALALEYLHEEEGIGEAGTFLAEAEAQIDDEKSLAIVIGGLRKIAASRGRRILLLIDNFEQVFPKRGTNDRDEHTLRKLLSNESFLMIIGTSTRLFEDVFGYDEAFYNFFSPVPVGNLGNEEIQELLEKRAKIDDNYEFLRDYEKNKLKIQAITHLTGGNPRLIMMLYEVLGGGQILSVVEALRATIDNLTPLFKDILESLPAQQQKILDALMRLDGIASPSSIAVRSRLPLNAVTTQLGRLKQASMVDVQGEGKGKPAIYKVGDQLFRTWYQMRYLRPARRRVEIFVELLRAWYSEEQRTQSLDQLDNRFKTYFAEGLKRQALEAVSTMEYMAASMENLQDRAHYLKLTSNAYAEIGDIHQAALSLADIKWQRKETDTYCEEYGYIELGEKYRQEGRFKEGIKAFSEALKKNKNNPDVRLGLGLCYAQLEDYEKALKEFNAIMKYSGHEDDIYCRTLYNRGIVKRHFGNINGEFEDYSDALTLKHVSPEKCSVILNNIGVRKTEIGDIKGAIEIYSRILVIKDAPVEQVAIALIRRGGRKRDLGDIEGEIEDYTKVLNLNGAPVDQIATAYNNRGYQRRMGGDIEGAISDFTKVENIQEVPAPILAKALGNRGEIKKRLGDTEGAISDLTKALSVDGISIDEKVNCLNIRSNIKAENVGDLDGAFKDLEEALNVRDISRRSMAMTIYNRAVLKSSIGNFKSALDDYIIVSGYDDLPIEEKARALLNRGVMKSKLGDIDGEIDDYNSILGMGDILPEQEAMVLINRAISRENKKDWQGANEDFSKVIELSGISSDQKATAYLSRGALKGNLGDEDGEISDLTMVIYFSDISIDQKTKALNNRGIRYGKMGKIHEGINDFNTIINMKDVSPEALSHAFNNRGISKLKLDDKPGAIVDYTNALEIKNTTPEEMATALKNRGFVKGQLGDFRSAIEDYTAILDIENISIDMKARALNNRADIKSKKGDIYGAIQDYSDLLDIEEAPIEEIATALINRGAHKQQIVDLEGAIVDYKRAVEITNIPSDLLATAILNYGQVLGTVERHHDALKEFNKVINIPKISDDNYYHALLYRGIANAKIGNIDKTIEDFEKCLEFKVDFEIFRQSFTGLIGILCEEKDVDEIKTLIKKIDASGWESIPIDILLEICIGVIIFIAQKRSYGMAIEVSNTFLHTKNQALTDRLHFLIPSLEYTESGNESVLGKLPQEEQDLARRIATKIWETKKE